ncbi:DUF2029 domain-containing protein [Halorubellus sp. JP-L1]|uniref:glycosyltransferase family 87 protein n=1 Tax=Halorubellus sp. JP-L1 TaxID=2715753 RepID=UPI00140A3540|nr:glycosyltransferase family 87 protein [Halorubellus sp. JP-L1]NHN43453.1 DUF2029 domain-containing protein [Halorubellus sp. JP-L1]
MTESSRRLPRVALAVGILLGLYTLVAMSRRKPGLFAVNFEVYYYAAEAVLSGGDLYGARPPGHPAYGYLYPPVVALAFVPYALLPSPWPGFLLHTLVQVASGVALGTLALRVAERHGASLERLDRALVVGYATLSVHVMPSLYYGNVNPTLALALGAAVVWVDRSESARAGVTAAAAALVKVFPAAVGLWFLRNRSWKAVGSAVAAGVGALLASVALFGVDVHRRYVDVALLGRLGQVDLAGGMSPSVAIFTLRRPLSVTFTGAPSWAVSLGAVVAVVPVVAYCYRSVSTPVERLVGAYVTVAALLVALPSYFVYFPLAFLPLLALLYVLEGRPQRVFAAGVLVANAAYTLPTVERAIRRLPLPDAATGVAVDAVAPVFTFATPPLYGTVLCLAGCVLAVRERRTASASA